MEITQPDEETPITHIMAECGHALCGCPKGSYNRSQQPATELHGINCGMCQRQVDQLLELIGLDYESED